MKINQDNYEQFFLDHAEGNLSPELERELTDFLESNPDLKSLLNSYDPLPLPSEEINNDSLKRRIKKNIHPTIHINEDNIDDWMIGHIEGLLSETEENELKEFLSLNPAYVYDQKLFGLTRLVPDPAITFTRKNELKKKGLILPVYRLAWLIPAAAAVILLFIGIRYFQSFEVDITTPVKAPEIVSVVEIPEAEETLSNETPSQETPSQKTPSQKTPSQKTPFQETPSYEPRPSPFRLSPSFANAMIIPELTESSEIELIAYDFPPISTVEIKKKPFIGKVFSNLIAQGKEGISGRTKPDKNNKPDFSFWTLAKAGVEGYNSITDRDLELYVRRDEAGNVKSYSLIEDDRLLLSKTLK